jgi:DNA-binding NtrC family response regulator
VQNGIFTLFVNTSWVVSNGTTRGTGSMHQAALANAQARVVLVDRDSQACREVIGALRTMLPDAMTTAAASGRQALDLLRRAACDLLLVDAASTADLAGNEDEALGRLVRAAAGALVVVLSDGCSVSAAIGAMQSGAHEVVTRPIDRADFQNRVAALARRHGRTQLLPHAPDWLGEGAAVPSGTAGVSGGRTVLPMWRQEQLIIEEAIRQFSGNITMAAAALELSPSTIYRKRQAWAEMEGRKGAA